jgi:hypothetical protein
VVINPATTVPCAGRRTRWGATSLTCSPLTLAADGSPRVNRTPDDSNTLGIIPQGTGTSWGNLWGVPICETTQCPAGTTVVMSITAGAAFGYTRLGMLLQYNRGETLSGPRTTTCGAAKHASLSLRQGRRRSTSSPDFQRIRLWHMIFHHFKRMSWLSPKWCSLLATMRKD